MEWLSLLLNLVLGGGTVGVLLFFGARRRKEEAEADRAETSSRGDELDVHRQNVEFLSSQLSEAWGEVEKLQAIVNAKREEILALMRQTKELEIELIEEIARRRRAELATCQRAECADRLKS